jgi:type II pantothenate kinase
LNGTLTPEVLSLARAQAHAEAMAKGLEVNGGLSKRSQGKGKHRSRPSSTYNHPHLRRSSLPTPLPGGLLNFTRFETSNIDALITFLRDLISISAKANRVSLKTMQTLVKVMATGGGAHMYYDRLRTELGVEVRREEEMECLIRGLGFVATVPEEVFWYSEELVWQVSHSSSSSKAIPPPITLKAEDLPRPSPNPPTYQVTFDPEPAPHFPCLLVNIGSGVSIVKIDEDGSFERVSGTSLGGGTLWGLLSLMTDATSFDGKCLSLDDLSLT